MNSSIFSIKPHSDISHLWEKNVSHSKPKIVLGMA